jgi:flagellar biosynthesis protein
VEEDIRRRRAVALRYDPEREEAPRVVASGKGHLAVRIEELAREAGVPLRQDDALPYSRPPARPPATAAMASSQEPKSASGQDDVLAEYLAALDLYQEIPPALYAAVAEILAFVYRLDGQRRERARGGTGEE